MDKNDDQHEFDDLMIDAVLREKDSVHDDLSEEEYCEHDRIHDAPLRHRTGKWD